MDDACCNHGNNAVDAIRIAPKARQSHQAQRHTSGRQSLHSRLEMNLSGSFWATAFGTDLGNEVSPIISILEREQFTLLELLSEGDFIQEVKTLNIQLIDLSAFFPPSVSN